MGRPKTCTKYKPEYCQQMIDFFNRDQLFTERAKQKRTTKNGTEIVDIEKVGCELPLFESFAANISVSSRTLRNWQKQYPAFREATERCRDHQARILVSNGLNGVYNALYARICSINILQWKDGSRDIQHGGSVQQNFKNLSDSDLEKEIQKRAATAIIPFRRSGT